MILVTGAAGKTGRAVIRAVVARGMTVRALVRRPAQAGEVEALGAQETVAGDMRDEAVLERAAQGVRAVYHICPNMHPDEVIIGRAAIAAARKVGGTHFVYHSVLHPQVEAMPHHWLKMQVEALLFESGLAYTILQPAIYMQNLLAHRQRIVEEGVYPVPYPVETRLGLVDLEDVAAAAAIVLADGQHDDQHAGATYELAGPDVLTQTEVAHTLGQQLGRAVHARAVPLLQWERNARAAGRDYYQVEALQKMFQYYARYGFWGNPRVLGWLLGREPASLADFARRTFGTGEG